MEIDENDKCIDYKSNDNKSCLIEDVEENDCPSKHKVEKELEDCDNFKKPTLTARIPAKKTTLHKYLQQKNLSNESNCTNKTINSESIDETVNEIPQEIETKQIPAIKPKPTPLPYTEPEWKGLAVAKYQLEEVKSGVIERTVDLQTKSYFSFGRTDACDICMAHPTVSRFHAILQYRGIEDNENEKGFYLYDLKSTHGTFLNKYRIKPNVYARVKVGHMIKIGCSTRFFILQGPAEDEEEESPLSLTDLKAQRQAEIEERKKKEEEERLLEEQERERQERLLEERGISWGMGEDADEETDLSENPYAQITNEELYIDDPKKALRNWFEREGEEFNIDLEKAEKGMFVAKVILPIDDGDGREIVVEMTGRSKKEAQIQCSIEACRVIDKMGLLRPAKREAKKQQKRNWEENDYYDSDEDSFLDRTGDLDKKREKRMRKAGKIQDTVETYESLMEKHKIVLEKLQVAERKLNRLLENMKVIDVEQSEEDMDELDAYMKTLKQKKPQKIDVKIAKDNVNKLQEEEAHLRKLINITKPANIPELILRKNPVEDVSSSGVKNDGNKRKEVSRVQEVTNTLEIEKEEPAVSKKPSRIIGPTFPSNSKLPTEIKSKNSGKSKKEQEDPNFVEDDVYSSCIWKPPPGQTGDGRTALNEKYGY